MDLDNTGTEAPAEVCNISNKTSIQIQATPNTLFHSYILRFEIIDFSVYFEAMHPALHTRKGIPFFHDKTPSEFQKDVYEHYDEMVVRQSALHLADAMWGRYPFQAVLDFAKIHYPEKGDINILDIGCGVGRWIGTMAKDFPEATLNGIDYSYQMLKQANQFWVEGKEISIDIRNKGFSKQLVKGERLENLKFGLAKAEMLPFVEGSQDLIVSSFLIDRLENPIKGLEEMYRVLKTDGKLIVVSPLNFNRAQHWKTLYPPFQFKNTLKEIGLEMLDWKEDIIVEEPLDAHENLLSWKCLGFVAKKALRS